MSLFLLVLFYLDSFKGFEPYLTCFKLRLKTSFFLLVFYVTISCDIFKNNLRGFNNMFCWLYILNLTLLICHEIESAYWKEWELFNLPGEITCFVILHIPIIFFFIFGIIPIYLKTNIGMFFSLVLALAGIFCFTIHTYFIRKGKNGFNLKISKFLLLSILALSTFQLILIAKYFL